MTDLNALVPYLYSFGVTAHFFNMFRALQISFILLFIEERSVFISTFISRKNVITSALLDLVFAVRCDDGSGGVSDAGTSANGSVG